jgi:hypothetical protein
MSVELTRIAATMKQIELMLGALDELHRDVLPGNPQLFAVMAEGPLDELQRMRGELCEYLTQLPKPAERVA